MGPTRATTPAAPALAARADCDVAGPTRWGMQECPASPTRYGPDPGDFPDLPEVELSAADGSCYKGQWLDGKKHGQGTYICECADPPVRAGEGGTGWRYCVGVGDVGVYAGRRQRYAHDTRRATPPRALHAGADGAMYDGEWNADRFHGQGPRCDAGAPPSAI